MADTVDIYMNRPQRVNHIIQAHDVRGVASRRVGKTESIGDRVFANTGATVIIPSSVTSIGDEAFYDCGYRVYNIPSSVTTIGDGAFFDTTNINYNGSATGSPWGAYMVNGNVSEPAANEIWYDYDDVVEFTGDVYDSSDNALTVVDNEFNINKKYYVITFSGNISYIETIEFADDVYEVVVPSTVTEVENDACNNLNCGIIYYGNRMVAPGYTCPWRYNIIPAPTNLTITCSNNTVTISATDATTIEYSTTSSSGPWTTYTEPFSINETVMVYAKASNSGGVITLSQECVYVEPQQLNDEIWYTSGNGDVVTPYSVNFGTGITVVSNTYSGGKGIIKLSGNATTFGDDAFNSRNGLTSINIPDSVTSIGYSTFRTCYNLTSVTIPNGVTTIGDYAFYYCQNLTSITIPNSVTSISERAFYGCSGLTSVTIGNGVTTIGNGCFQQCSSLTSITSEAMAPPTLINNSAFELTNNCPIYVPAASVDTYKSAWSFYASRIQAIQE